MMLSRDTSHKVLAQITVASWLVIHFLRPRELDNHDPCPETPMVGPVTQTRVQTIVSRTDMGAKAQHSGTEGEAGRRLKQPAH